MKKLTQQTKKIINKIIYITVATSSNGQPWNTPVYAVHDDKYNFYWISWKKSQHSKNISENKKAFIVIYNSTRPLGTNILQSVYIKAEAHEVNNGEELESAVGYLNKSENKKYKLKDFTGNNPKRIYKAIPKKFWLNAKSESMVNRKTKEMRVEVKGIVEA